jgi:hypothetical protein
MSSLPAGTPIILFCLDNSSFLTASEEGGLSQVRRLAAARDRTTETQPAGAGPPQLPRRSLEGATGRPTQPVVCTHTSPGTPQEAAVSIRGEEKPEAVASQPNVVAETTGVGIRAAAGVGPGAAGNHAAPPGSHSERVKLETVTLSIPS